MNSIPNKQESVHWLYIFTEVIQQPVFYSGMLLKNPPNCLKKIFRPLKTKKTCHGTYGEKPNNPKPAGQPVETLRSCHSFGVGSVKANELTDARGIVASHARFPGFGEIEKRSPLKKRGGETIILVFKPFGPFFFFLFRVVLRLFAKSMWSEGAQQLGRYTQTDSVKTYRLTSA